MADHSEETDRDRPLVTDEVDEDLRRKNTTDDVHRALQARLDDAHPSNAIETALETSQHPEGVEDEEKRDADQEDVLSYPPDFDANIFRTHMRIDDIFDSRGLDVSVLFIAISISQFLVVFVERCISNFFG